MRKFIIKYKKIWMFILTTFIFAVPAFVYSAGLVPCTNGANDPCKFNNLIDLVRNIVRFLMFGVALPLSAIMFSWAGVLMLTAGGNETKIKTAKDIFLWVFVGILITLAAWLIIDTITGALLTPDYKNFIG